ncbi:MAG: hypothetical protein F9K22_12420 [Bacteroidetes bacterium]|nr:MAG: hypothetical protein F9K22_12420 [Bacteroidota bacterium]
MKRLMLTTVLMLAACNDTPTDPVSDAEGRWKAAGIHDYTIEQMRSCFCFGSGEWVRLTVRSDTLFSAVRLSDGAPVLRPELGWYLSVDSLFGLIRHSSADSLVVVYDERYGFPSSLDVNPQLHPVDGGVLYTTANLTPSLILPR